MANLKDPDQQPAPTRPQMPAAYGVDPAAREGLLPWSYVSERMASSRNYWVGSTRPDGRPHSAPVWGLWLDEAFYFSTDPSSRKGRNLAANPEIAVHLESGDEVVILEGVVEQAVEASVLERFAHAYEAKYEIRVDVENADYGVYRLRPRVAYAWREQDFPASATRWLLDRA